MRTIYITATLVSLLLLPSLTSFAQTPSRKDLIKEIQTRRAELAELEKNFLAPNEEDRTLYAEFLKQPNTGLVRLLPRDKFDTDGNKEGKRGIVMRGGGAYYSFVRLTQEYNYGSDLELSNEQFSVGFAGADYGFLANIGDVALESVGPETPQVAEFGAYKSARLEPVARTEYRRFQEGAKLDDVFVKSRVPVLGHSTYLLRSIGYVRSDVLVAFRVVRIDSDGSVTILWKLMKKFGMPKLNPPEPVGIG